MRKIIISDIDGTLVQEGGRDLNPEYYEVISKLVDKGNIFVAASGRASSSMKTVIGPVVDKIWITSQNGNIIEHGDESETMNSIPLEWLHELSADLTKYEGADIVVNTAKVSFGLHPDSFMFNFLKNNYGMNIKPIENWDLLASKELSMFAIYHPDAATFLKESNLKEKWSGRLDMLQSGEFWIDCVIPGINKGAALKAIAEKCKVPMENTIAFGDNINDITLLQAAGKSYAVANAQPATKEIADEIIPGFKEDGVLQVLKKMLEE